MSKLTLRTLATGSAVALLGVAALPASAADYARVISATPVVVPVTGSQRECVTEARVVQRQPSGAGALLGAIVGGVVGNQIGGGTGRAIATGVGAVAGAGLGNQIEADSNGYAAVPATRCRNVATNAGSRLIGYDVVYDFHGQRYSTRTATDPGAQIMVDVRPVGGSSVPAPQTWQSAPRTWQPVPQSGWQPVPPAAAWQQPVPAAAEPVPVTTYYDDPAPVVYGAPAPVTYYDAYPANYWAPAIVGTAIGVGLGYSAARHWNRGWYGPPRVWAPRPWR